MSFKVFYAWQSDTKGSLNRSFIEDAARKALKAIKADLELEDSPRLDQATQDEAGMCEIATTILRKIDEATIFLADLTLVGRIDPGVRNTPNPNVLFELGYAVNRLGWENIVSVMNVANGTPEQQIFDLRGRSFVRYKLDRNSDENQRRHEKALLVKQIRNAIATILQKKTNLAKDFESDPEAAMNELDQLIRSNDDNGLNDMMVKEARGLVDHLTNADLADFQNPIFAKDVEDRLETYTTTTNRLASLLARGCRRGGPDQCRTWKDCIEIIGWLPPRPSNGSTEFEISRCLRLYPALMSFYAAGIAALIGEKWDTLRFLFHEPRVAFQDSVQSPAVALTPWEVLARGKRHDIAGHGNYMGRKAPLSLYLHKELSSMLIPLTNRPEDYSKAFDTFEYLLGLCCLDFIEKGVEGRGRPDASVGMFATRPDGLDFVSGMEDQLDKDKWPPLQAQVIQSTYSECKKTMALYRTEVELFQGNRRYGRRPNQLAS